MEIKQECIVTGSMEIYGYELLFGMPDNPESDFKKFILLVDYANYKLSNGSKGKFFYINIFPKTLIQYKKFIKDFLKNKNIIVELIERNSSIDLPLLSECPKEMDIKISIDDFGTGSSNFDRLNLPYIHSVKFDFIWKDRHHWELAKHLVKKLKEKNILSIAEKIETEEEFQLVKEIGFDLFQGYYVEELINEKKKEKTI